MQFYDKENPRGLNIFTRKNFQKMMFIFLYHIFQMPSNNENKETWGKKILCLNA